MSTTRKLITDFSNLKKVTPTKSLVICSAPCEIKAAEIRNKTIKYIQKNRTADVVYLYLKNQRGKDTTSFGLFLSVFVGLFFIYSYCYGRSFNDSDQGKEFIDQSSVENIRKSIMIAALTLLVANIIPNLSNYWRYRESENLCEEWLSQKLKLQEFEKIKKFRFFDFEELEEILKRNKINSSLLESHDLYHYRK